ncbi:MAG TPA: T9SS type A sorting domain-containing protein [Bacteroidota bacterium]|nr:T9SS type A sorting domain-containing protein [Bacteroidota bacterium]
MIFNRFQQKIKTIMCWCLMMFTFATLSASDKKPGKEQERVHKISGLPISTLMNVNKISMWASGNGLMERRPDNLTAGVMYPRDTTSVIYGGGLIWGGLVRDGFNPVLRVGGSTYNSGMVSGRIINPGVAENPDNADVRIYRIRKDWETADIRRDAAEIFDLRIFEVTDEHISILRNQYKKDWIEWPWQQGAPYYERNGIAGYQPDSEGKSDSTSDEPGLGNADQVLWFASNDLDPDVSRRLYGSRPIGIEMQVTCWAYARSDELNNVIYQRYRFIYKGTATTPPNAVIDSMYIAKWVDPDLGDFKDDLVACVIEKNLGFVYNSSSSDFEFNKFDLVPAVVGYDMLQGPRIKKIGSTARWNLSTIKNYENLPMTSFSYFTQVTRTTDVTLGSYTSTREWWNLLRGYRARPLANPRCFSDPTTDECTKYELWGDPQTYRGWVDGRQDPAGDRRFAMSSGPFSMAVGDTQEVVIGLMVAMGSDNRAGIGDLKRIDNAAQDALNVGFKLLDSIPLPPLRIVELDNTLILDWESDTAQVQKVESFQSLGYKFETYTIYQFPLENSSIDQAYVFPPFDIASPRYFVLTSDYIRKRPLVNGQKYYYAITSTVFNSDPTIAQQRIESPVHIKVGIPHSPNPGIVYPYELDEPVTGVENLVGVNDAKVIPKYFDPARAVGHIYKILFHRSIRQIIDINEKPTWDFIDSTTNDTLLRGIRMDTIPLRVITRGISVEALSPLHGLRGVYQVMFNNQPTRDVVFNKPDPGGNYMIVGAGSSQLDTILGGTANDSDLEFRFTGDSSWALFIGGNVPKSRWVRVPYQAWYVGKTSGDSITRQVWTFITHQGQDTVWRPAVLLDRAYDGQTLKVFYPITIISDSINIDGTWLGGTYYDDVLSRPDSNRIKGYLWVNSKTKTDKSGIWRAYIADIDGDGAPAPVGTIVRFERFKVVRNADEKIFKSSSIIADNIDAARREVEKINVFPNPYYGLNRAELNRFQRFMTFNHLPQIATIRIFNLSGVLVKTIYKNDDSQFINWDLNNEHGLPVASGMYLAHVELRDRFDRDLGSKSLKLMIVPEEQFIEVR